MESKELIMTRQEIIDDLYESYMQGVSEDRANKYEDMLQRLSDNDLIREYHEKFLDNDVDYEYDVSIAG